MTTVYLNGEFVPKADAKISVDDRGFVFGDGIYEVIPVHGGRLFRPDAHLSRLERSATALRLRNPAPQKAIKQKMCADGHQHNDGNDLDGAHDWPSSPKGNGSERLIAFLSHHT